MKNIDDMKEAYNTNKDLKEYVDRLIMAYGWSLERALQSPITKEYYKYLMSC